MLQKFIDKILHEDEDIDKAEAEAHRDLGEKIVDDFEEAVKKEIRKIEESVKKPIRIKPMAILVPLILFLLAFGVRLAFMLTHDPQSPGYDWYGDVYHHWQIAYLSKEIGFKVGFLRLWDFKGLEFFWGLMHPLILIFLFNITGSVSILIPRYLSIFCGSMVVVFLYLLIKRHFNRLAAFLVGLWAALFSVVLFSDSLGMQEQLGLFFLLAGMLAWPNRALLTGLFWATASMVRSEYWLFAFALVLASFFDKRKKSGDKKVVLLAAYLIPMVLYMKYMLTYTGNAIFPIYWNYLASYQGEWFTNTADPLTSVQIIGQLFGRGLFVVGVSGALVTLWRRMKDYQFYLLGFFNITFIGAIFGFGAYIHGFFERFYVDRLLAFPYLFLGLIPIVILAGWLPRQFRRLRIISLTFGVIFTLVLITASQLAWKPILHYLKIAQAGYDFEIKVAEFIAEQDPGGKILFPANRPALFYTLVYGHHLDGKRVVGNMYDPYYYAAEGQVQEEVEEAMLDWLEREDINFFIRDKHDGRTEYKELVQNHSEFFQPLGQDESVELYEFLR